MIGKRARTSVQSGKPDEFLADVARAYYEQHLTQEQIAAQFVISRSQVSRYLAEGLARDIVQIRIALPDARDRQSETALAGDDLEVARQGRQIARHVSKLFEGRKIRAAEFVAGALG